MDTIIINSENSKASKPHVLTLQLNDKTDLQRGKKRTALSNLGYLLYMEKPKKLIQQ